MTPVQAQEGEWTYTHITITDHILAPMRRYFDEHGIKFAMYYRIPSEHVFEASFGNDLAHAVSEEAAHEWIMRKWRESGDQFPSRLMPKAEQDATADAELIAAMEEL